MKRSTCPYLGLKDDPTTDLDYPSQGNHCHHARPIIPVKSSHQQKFCLSRNHAACPIYQANQPVVLPLTAVAPAYLREKGLRVLATIGIPVVVASMAALTLGWNILGSSITNQRAIPDTGNFATADPSVTAVPKNGQIQAPAGPRNVSSPISPPPNCPLPDGWVVYIVNPTDSLFRLSVIYGVSVEELQRVNCLGSSTAILPGQVIYIPYIPTKTPIIARNNAGQPFQSPSIRPPVIIAPPTPTQAPPPDSPATSVPPTSTIKAPTGTPVPSTPTSQPPTNTPVPPTNTPVRPTNTPIRPTRTPRPTNTPVPQTNTPVIPTNTPPPTNTAVPPTPIPTTPVPPTEEFLPTNTAVPPTAEPPPTNVPPTPTDAPPPTDEPPPPTLEPSPPPTEEPPPPTAEPPPTLEPPVPTEEPPAATTEPPPLFEESLPAIPFDILDT